VFVMHLEPELNLHTHTSPLLAIYATTIHSLNAMSVLDQDFKLVKTWTYARILPCRQGQDSDQPNASSLGLPSCEPLVTRLLTLHYHVDVVLGRIWRDVK